MTNFAAPLKAETSRIARKEIRSEVQGLKKASVQYRSDIAALKRRVSTLESTLTKLSKVRGCPQEATGEVDQVNLRFRSEGFASLRKKLDLSAADMARLLGVSAQSVYHWEAGKSKPRRNQMASIAEVRKLGRREAAEILTSK